MDHCRFMFIERTQHQSRILKGGDQDSHFKYKLPTIVGLTYELYWDVLEGAPADLFIWLQSILNRSIKVHWLTYYLNTNRHVSLCCAALLFR